MTLLQDLLALKKPTQVAESHDDMTPEQLRGLADQLDSVADELLMQIEQLKRLTRKLPSSLRGSAQSYWLPQIEIAVGGDHTYMVASHQDTLAKTIAALRDEADEMDNGDQDEDRDR